MNNYFDTEVPKRNILIALTSETTLRAFYRELILYLKNHGWRVDVVVSENQDLNELSKQLDVTIHQLEMARNPNPIRDFVALIGMYKIIRSTSPRILLAATPKASFLAIPASFFAGVETRIYQIWGLRYESMSGLSRTFFKIFEVVTARFANKVTANSFSLANQIQKDRIASEVTVIGAGSSHGIDTSYFSRRQQLPRPVAEFEEFINTNEQLPLVLFVGRITRDKGISTLLKAQQIAIGKNLPFRLVIIGEMEDKSIQIEIVSSSNPYLLQLDFASDVRPYLVEADLLCLPSLREGFPNVVLEAAAMEVPSIVSDATGVIDSVVPGVTGFVFPVGDSNKLQELISQLAKSSEIRKRLGKSARKHAMRFYSQKHFFPLFESFLDEQIN